MSISTEVPTNFTRPRGKPSRSAPGAHQVVHHVIVFARWSRAAATCLSAVVPRSPPAVPQVRGRRRYSSTSRIAYPEQPPRLDMHRPAGPGKQHRRRGPGGLCRWTPCVSASVRSSRSRCTLTRIHG
jgi:hypothetical protein